MTTVIFGSELTQGMPNNSITFEDPLILHFVIKIVSSTFCLPSYQVRQKNRGKAHVAFARQVAMYLAHVCLGFTFTDVGRFFGRDRTTAAYACQIIEDYRDDGNFDAFITTLENTLLNLASERVDIDRTGGVDNDNNNIFNWIYCDGQKKIAKSA